MDPIASSSTNRAQIDPPPDLEKLVHVSKEGRLGHCQQYKRRLLPLWRSLHVAFRACEGGLSHLGSHPRRRGCALRLSLGTSKVITPWDPLTESVLGHELVGR